MKKVNYFTLIVMLCLFISISLTFLLRAFYDENRISCSKLDYNIKKSCFSKVGDEVYVFFENSGEGDYDLYFKDLRFLYRVEEDKKTTNIRIPYEGSKDELETSIFPIVSNDFNEHICIKKITNIAIKDGSQC